MKLQEYASPAGNLLLGSFAGYLCLCDWRDAPCCAVNLRRLLSRLGCTALPGGDPILDRARRELDAYFAGDLKVFGTPLLLAGTDFQRRVRGQLLRVPYGSVVSYSSLARAAGVPGAVRAVAGAVASNPISIFVPCHRVVGADGSLTGYAGGLPAKRFLLALESGDQPLPGLAD